MTGFICVNKEAGVSSAREVSRIKKLTSTPCGHMGTLDPIADGVLPVAIGNAARLFDYFLDKRKKYIATFYFGADSDTLDTTGEVTYCGEVPSESEIGEILPQFTGEIDQLPPKYSAKRVGGARGYRLAREGVDFELQPKKVRIYSINLLKKVSEHEYTFSIECGGGTYVRSIARDIAAKLKTHAVMSALTRTASGIFTIENSVKTSELTPENINEFILPTESVLPYDSIYADEISAKRLFNGLSVESRLPDGIYKIYSPDKSFYGLAEVKQTILKIRKKLC